MVRGSGRTTKQMLDAPKDAVFVWVNHHLDYPKHLAMDLGRQDLEIVSPSWLDPERINGTLLSGLILDHAIDHERLTDRQWGAIEVARLRVMRYNTYNAK